MIDDLEALLTPDALLNADPDLVAQIQQMIKELSDYKKFNRLNDFKPFWYQEKFMEAGKDHKIRFFQAGNRTGKTYGTAAEFTYHLTGLYPDNWNGLIVPDGGHTYWVIGVNLESTARVIQKELIGSIDCRLTDLVGTGTIPRDCLILDEGWQQDIGRLKSCFIRHKSGAINTLMFYGCENEAAMMGQKVRGIWMDEEPPYNSEAIFSQCVTRLQNAGGVGIDGFMILTATPENGQTALIDIFDFDKTGTLYKQRNTMFENPTLNPQQIADYLAAIPEWQRDMRAKGIPAAGNGAVFKIKEEDFIIPDCVPLPHWETVIGVDWGIAQDPTVIIVAVRDPNTDTHYIYDEIYLDEDEEARTPENVARILLNGPYRSVPVVCPHDNPAKRAILQRLGVNIHGDIFRNPPASMLKNVRIGNASTQYNDVNVGLDEMRLMFYQGRLKVLDRCYNWIRERRSYSYIYNRTTGKTGLSKTNDHAIDASRYALLSLVGNINCRWDETSNDNYYSEPQSLHLNF
ncbi:hypothetical protein B9R80_002416 [Salmonella enterica]|nr:hypothetical protein [Salmonella enterica]